MKQQCPSSSPSSPCRARARDSPSTAELALPSHPPHWPPPRRLASLDGHLAGPRSAAGPEGKKLARRDLRVVEPTANRRPPTARSSAAGGESARAGGRCGCAQEISLVAPPSPTDASRACTHPRADDGDFATPLARRRLPCRPGVGGALPDHPAAIWPPIARLHLGPSPPCRTCRLSPTRISRVASRTRLPPCGLLEAPERESRFESDRWAAAHSGRGSSSGSSGGPPHPRRPRRAHAAAVLASAAATSAAVATSSAAAAAVAIASVPAATVAAASRAATSRAAECAAAVPTATIA